VAISLRNGTLLLTLTTIATVALRLITNIILTRLLTPEVFGQVGVIVSISVVLTLVTDLGFQPFLVRHGRGDDKDFINTIWTLKFIRSMVLAAVMLGAAPLLAQMYGQPSMVLLVAVGSILFVFDALNSLSLISAIRRERAGYLSVFEFVITLLQTGLMIGLAYYLRNVWAILLTLLCSAAMRTLGSYALFPDSTHRFRIEKPVVMELLHFAKYIAASSTIYLILTQGDKIVFSNMLTLSEFGLFMLASNLVLVFGTFSTLYASRVAYPRFAKAHAAGSGELALTYYSSRWYVTLPLALCSGGLLGAAWLVVEILFDERYLGAAPFLALLAIAPPFQYSVTCADQCLVAAGQVRTTLLLNIVRVVGLILAAIVGYRFYGTMGMIAALGVMDLPPMLCAWYFLKRNGILNIGAEMAFFATFALGIALGKFAHLSAHWLVAQGWLPAF
jgi:O-antigen/teichoic acid export membrane protein